MIKEYQSECELDHDHTWKWQNKISVDLHWVASACPGYLKTTLISMCGSNQTQCINVPYETFMVDWMKTKQ